LAFIAPTAGCVNIDIAIAIALARFLIIHRCRVTISPSLAVELPSRSHRSLLSRRALHHPQFAIAPSIATHCRCALGPSPPRSCRPSPMRSCRAVPRHQGAVVPSIAVPIEEPSRHPLPSRSRCTVPHHRGAVAPSIAVKEPSRRPSPSRSHRPCLLTTPATRHAPPRPLVWMVVALPLLTLPPSICWCLSLRQRRSCLSSVRLVVTSPCFSCRHLPSAGASPSHRAIASCHAPLRSRVQLVKVSPLLSS